MKRIIVLFLVFIIAGCNNQLNDNKQQSEMEEDKNIDIAKNYLEELGYDVISYETKGSLLFTKSDLLDLPGEQIWGVQYTEPDNFLNKEINTVSFMVKNHPLDNLFNMGKTNATVLIFNEEVIGGWSFPHSKEPLIGAFYSIDGKTMEEIHGDLQKWRDEWENKYKN
ncbi:hypothetical protein U5N28_10350 [Lysinibacillus telephonicus]|uniref:Lipoprotein n=1 Tax=Lysinibacillus telephonicus TaxID=1714840 RepID=A0A431ULP1_9BACI|nr:hypothetical protein [Lysinibacillus telephonicus]RTQ90834.1 hypothetical protein EKG35_14280 [Lysinibacillus telephonicus]